ncbi:IclR family transcriptional regulator [Streptomyces litchfieldiae]|uniref:IclR family transcriptional regulator C-terminal domain-containing protein n=1 Tax=Streptomyces litchfieldiae TaxID=3075543 RepID=A0ABU2MMV8_9ACTN|nr:IclR family transcriptional regulator C-terminal domain-containing protein [Streptomyces sp. DSM 44938]MDT0342950.1 IclR family transcriptional regulator C-terminal domain-containing protein [Streptomyces sp. DSM 44938]
MATTSGRTAPFQSARQALRLLEAIAGHPDGLTEEELARRAGLPPVLLPPLLKMLCRDGYLRRLSDGGYAAGETLILLGAGGDRRAIRQEKLQQALDALRDSLGAAVYLARYTDGELEVALTSDTPQTPQVNEWVDFRSAAHATAIGKCLLSQLDHEGRQDHLSRHKAARLTSRTITDQRALLSALDRQPPTMPVLDLQEYAVGTLCAAVPLTAGASVGCLALSLPVGQAHRLRRAAEALNRQAAPTLLSLSL